ncbi:osmotically inducible family protein [Tieghemostelium lacteum]|uniref:Osmotically inducible family protein n=1 Tax=Tieghemostelium lacteum TaxID=361077 RepID=A0A151Z4Z5_TIELA|nr:osmotically inducible family protein [Tieghemostelium lacteum]|eukprot:KYQ88987.1 osmotically inducible family protein [Tieghemostelium lacteum]
MKHSDKAFNQLQRAENQCFLKTSLWFTDNHENPSVVLSLGIFSGVIFWYCNSIENLLNIIVELNWSKGLLPQFSIPITLDQSNPIIQFYSQNIIDYIYFSEMATFLSDIVPKYSIENKNFEFEISHVYEEHCVLTADSINIIDCDDPKIQYLVESDYDIIIEDWEYKILFTENEIKWSIKNKLAIGYKINDGQTAILKTLPEYRGKGIANKVVSRLLSEIKKLKLPYMICYIDCQNDVSINMHKKFGFKFSTSVVALRGTSDKEKYNKLLDDGDLFKGSGVVSTESKTLSNLKIAVPASNPTKDTATNPEELLGAAQAGCFSMSLSLHLMNKKLIAKNIDTTATVTMNHIGDNYTIDEVNIVCKADVPGATLEQFKEAADLAKAGCPVSKVLKCKITLNATLEGK